MLKKIILLYIVFVTSLFAIDATMEITKQKATLPTISVIVSSNINVSSKVSKNISTLVVKDLLVSGHFNNSEVVIDNKYDVTPNYKILKQNGIDLYLLLQIKSNNLNGLIVNSKLYDVNTNQLVLNKSYSTSNKTRYPFLSHKMAIDINDYLDAPSIKWMDKFVIFSRYLNAKESEIVVSDYTLTYQKVVVKGGLNIFPKWATQKQENFYYTTYKYSQPTLVKQNLYTKRTEKLLSSDGMIICSDVSKNGNKLILTMAPNSQPDIYIYDVKSRLKTRITKYNGIDVGGNFVDNDKKIVFVSDRLKYPNIFAKKIGEKGVERLIYHGRNNSQCTTYNNYIAYASRETDNEFNSNSFNLYLISTQSDYVRRLTTNGRNQFPKFSSDGQSILYIKNDRNNSYLGIIRISYNKSFLFALKTGKLQSIDW